MHADLRPYSRFGGSTSADRTPETRVVDRRWDLDHINEVTNLRNDQFIGRLLGVSSEKKRINLC